MKSPQKSTIFAKLWEAGAQMYHLFVCNILFSLNLRAQAWDLKLSVDMNEDINGPGAKQ